MRIPTKFRIKGKSYHVQHISKYKYMGGFCPVSLNVYLRKQQPDKTATFWHEVTHAVLHNMQHPLWRNERFVQEFSVRLSELIKTATFDK